MDVGSMPSTCALARSAGGKRVSNALTLALVGAWSALVACGLIALWNYAGAAGESSRPPGWWPAQSKIARDRRATLLVFAHPLCPCTRATLAELERLAAVCRDRMDIHVLFIAPDGTDASWRDSDLYATARRIPGASVQADFGRRESALFGVRTSGSCLFFAPDGRLLFEGGLTAARGHEGDNDGFAAVRALAMGENAPLRQTPVFGCPLFEPAACQQPDCPSK